MDLPRLNDARRMARLAMALDEIRSVPNSSLLFDMSEDEFRMCGGKTKKQMRYSLYRQIVYATRDLRGYVRRGRFPSAQSVLKAKQMFWFHDNKVGDDTEARDVKMKTKDCHRIIRMLIILQKFRRALRSLDRIPKRSEVHQLMDSFSLTYDEFLMCGGKKTKFYQSNFKEQFDYIIADLRRTFTRGRFFPPCVVSKTQRLLQLSSEYETNPFLDDSDEEDVDRFDAGDEGEDQDDQDDEDEDQNDDPDDDQDDDQDDEEEDAEVVD